MFVIVQEVYIITGHQKAQLIFTFQLVKNDIQVLIKTIYVSIWRSDHNSAMFLKHTSINFYGNRIKIVIRWI